MSSTPARSSGKFASTFLLASSGLGVPEPSAEAAALPGTTADGGVLPVQPTTTSVASDRPTASAAGQRGGKRSIFIAGSWLGGDPGAGSGGPDSRHETRDSR